jgi:type II secretory pathway component HofQ
MKSLLLLCLCCVPALARPVNVLPSKLVDLHCSRQPLAVALRSLLAHTGYNLVLTAGVTGTVTADLHAVPALHALGLVLKMQPTEYRYKIVGNTVVVGPPGKLRSIPDNVLDRR